MEAAIPGPSQAPATGGSAVCSSVHHAPKSLISRADERSSHAPRFLVRDNDGKFGRQFAAVAKGTGIEVVKIPPRSPNLNPICERFLGSVRRECLDHVVILSERQLRRILREYVDNFFNTARPHQGLGQHVPTATESCLVASAGDKVVPFPILGGLHHDYRWAA